MTRVDLGDGNQRNVSEVKISRVPGAFLVMLQDHETGQAMHTTCQSLDDAWDALEAALCNPATLWREFRSYKGPGKKAPAKK